MRTLGEYCAWPVKKLGHPRSRRLRKKLHVDEFQRMGFEVAFQFSHDLTNDQNDQFWDSFIAGAIEAHHLTFGGGLSGFVVPEGRNSATEAHRRIVHAWLEASPQVRSVIVGPLLDAWHSACMDANI